MKKITLLLLFAFYSMFCFSQDPTVYITNGGSNYSVIEGNTYTFTVSMYSATTTDVVIDVATIVNSADASDYTPLNTTITIPAGQISSNSLTIPTFNDSTVETDEYFTIEATVTSGNTANSNITRTITLWDNDTTPTVNTYLTPTRTEGQTYNQQIYLSNYFSSDVTINITSADITADASDYNAINTTITIPAGQRSSYFSINSIQDAITESDETYFVTATITSGNTTNNSLDITVTIKDDDTIPEFSISSNTASESYSGYVYVSLNRVYNSDVVLQLTTTNGTADNNDYTNTTQTKTIVAGYSYTNFQIPVTDDTLDEPEEFFSATIIATSGNTVNISETETITIIDNDGLPDFSIQANYYDDDDPNGQVSNNLAAEEGYDLKFTPRLTHPSPVDTNIVITTTNGTADNTDYTTSTINITIPAGQYVNYYEDYSYPTILDQLDEADENMFIDAVVTSGNTYNTNYTAEGIILDNYHLNAQRDDITSVLEVGTTYQLLDNDTFEGLPVIPGDLNVSLADTNSLGITLNASGVLTIPANLPIGYYSLNYQICEIYDPSNCDTAYIIIRVESPLEVSYTAVYDDFNGDGFTSTGDTVSYEFTVTNNGNAPITNIDAEVPYQDLDIVGGPLASLGIGQTDSTTFTALYIITQDDINFGYYAGDLEGAYFYGTYYGNEQIAYLFDEAQSFSLQQSDGIEVNAFVDTNGNGTQESGEINYPLGQFNYEINNDGVINNLYVSPHYLYESNPTTTYNLTYSVDSDYAAYNTTTASYNNITVPVGSGITTYDFPITVTPYNDLSIDISESWRPPIPGFHYWNYISYTNNSTETVTSGTIDFTIDNALNLLSVHEVSSYWYNYNSASYTTTATGFSYTFNNLQPFETKRLWVRMQVPTLPTVSLGQLVTNSVDIELLTGEIVPTDNSSSLTQTIVGSYDPNDITEKHGEDIVQSTFSTDDYLTYTIRFENTGTANAINIRVEDLLDEQLDESTLKMVDASHAYSLERVGKQLEWNFSGVNLPPSQDDDSQIGHGFITFKIKPFPDYAVGDVIPNTAEIYFDFNPAIITNTWNTNFVESLSINDLNFSDLTVFPNPVKDVLLISNSSNITSVEITSVLGKQIVSTSVEALHTEMDLSELSNGVYFVKIKGDEGERIVKIIKE
ncbi:Calx-beta domain-containing protein [uncultured Winogradskyella sp.]|uniref:DUF7619 domain-containing protein n=1 Tax=uncultured Winogradskyella sp. TaxID=395353 RepID=UPI00262CE782|nr:Calx-beta domain-containing protein [uncultured Winogradskyella sp.]